MYFQFTKKTIDSNIVEHGSDTSHFQDNTDETTDNQKVYQKTDSKKKPPPACFKKCAQCQKLNPNPYYQYCMSCFEVSIENTVCWGHSKKGFSKIQLLRG